MQELKGARRIAKMKKWRPSHIFFRIIIILLLVLIGGITLLHYNFPTSKGPHSSPGTQAAKKTVATNGASLWDGDKKATIPTFDFSLSGTQVASVSPLFASYYHSHSGMNSLGVPLTVAFPSEQGWIQFFRSGALLLPTVQYKHISDPENLQPQDPLAVLLKTGVKDSSSGIIRLPLLQALLTVGSEVQVGGDESLLTYLDLRKATNPDLMQPASSRTGTLSSAASQEVFVTGGTRDGKKVGHLIPEPLWSYINRADISPDGWETDFGTPLTEALAFTITTNGKVHQMLVQAFWEDGVLLDQSILDARGQPQIQRLDSGLDYLRTLGPPPVATSIQQTIWVQGETTLLNAPGTGHIAAHLGQHFPLTILGDTSWSRGMLWYHVQWTVPKRTADGWVEAPAISFISPGTVPGWASLDALSPGLAAYLASIGGNVDVAVYDVTRQRYYTYNASAQFLTGSSMKVPIMLTFLDMTERENRQPNANEMYLLTTMIENSNNDSAETLYHSGDGDAPGVAAYMQKIGISGLSPYPGAFGWSLITPLAMVNLLTDLYEGKILTAHDRNLALYLMEHIESDQQVGVGDTAPTGATVAMKDGWVPGPDNLWAMNSSGIVTVGQETYIIAVYTQEQQALGDGQAIARHVCRSIASLLT